MLGLWQSAVELALTFDTKLAQDTASKPSDRELQRKLWLVIAEYEIKGNNDVKQALDLLKKCDLLRIEDLLPFFDDFEKIDHFKEAICDALKVFRKKTRKTMPQLNFISYCRNIMRKFKNNAKTWKNQQNRQNVFEMIYKHSVIVQWLLMVRSRARFAVDIC